MPRASRIKTREITLLFDEMTLEAPQRDQMLSRLCKSLGPYKILDNRYEVVVGNICLNISAVHGFPWTDFSRRTDVDQHW